MLWILDTDHISLFQRGNTAISQKIQQTPRSDLAVTVISYEEQVRGWLKIINQSASDLPNLSFGYRQLNSTLSFFSTKQVLEFNNTAIAQCQLLIQQKLRVGTQDLRIAAIVLSVNGTIVTRNL